MNQVVADWDKLKPPLANNFFQMALRSEKFKREPYQIRIAPLLDYVSHIWKKNRDDLQNEPFNLEDCFTMLQLQEIESYQKDDQKEYERLASQEFLLKSFLAEYLSEIENFAGMSDKMREFGAVIYREHPTILSLNYDCVIEEAIETASGVNTNAPQSFQGGPNEKGKVTDDELPYSHFNWNRPLGYGIKFDYVQLQRAGLPTYVEGNRFYGYPANKLYSWKILKLHGSLNWFHYLPIRKYQSFDPEEQQLPEERLKEVLLVKGRWWFFEPPDLGGWILDPLIITPVLYKEHYYDRPPFPDIWRQAREELSTCKRLIVIGYSFAPTDFYIRKLLLEAFCENPPSELIIVNPDTSVVQKVKELTHFGKPVLVCRDLEEYLRLNAT